MRKNSLTKKQSQKKIISVLDQYEMPENQKLIKEQQNIENQSRVNINDSQAQVKEQSIDKNNGKISKMSRTFSNFRSGSIGSIAIKPSLNKQFKDNQIINKQRFSLTHEAKRHNRKIVSSSDQLRILASNKSKNKQRKQRDTNLRNSKQMSFGGQSAKKSSAPFLKMKQNANQSRSESKKSYFSYNSKKSVPQQIQMYLKKRQDVEIVQYFEQYKKQFYTKSKLLHNYIQSTGQPQRVRNTYLSQTDSHFRNGLQAVMLKLFRNGTIVPHSYSNLRQEAVQQIQKWVMGWIHRKIMYGQLSQQEDNCVLILEDSMRSLQQYRRQINSQDISF